MHPKLWVLCGVAQVVSRCLCARHEQVVIRTFVGHGACCTCCGGVVGSP